MDGADSMVAQHVIMHPNHALLLHVHAVRPIKDTKTLRHAHHRRVGCPAELASARHRLQRFDCAPAPTRAHASKAAVGRDGCAAARQRGDAKTGGGRRARADGVGKPEVGAAARDARAHKERDVERRAQLQDRQTTGFRLIHTHTRARARRQCGKSKGHGPLRLHGERR